MSAGHEILSRRDAYERGLTRYYTGEVCERNHRSERYTSNGACIQCVTFRVPSKRVLKARNVYWPTLGVVSNLQQLPEPEEAEAAFRMIEHYGWFDHCINEIRKNPALLVQFAVPMQPKQLGPLAVQTGAAYERALREYERLKASLDKQEAVVRANLERMGSNKLEGSE